MFVKLTKNTNLNILVLGIIFDFILVHFFHFWILLLLKILLFLNLIVVIPCMLILGKSILVVDKGAAQGLGDITIKAEAEYFN